MRNKHLKMIEFTQVIGGIDVPMVALYNESRIDEETVLNRIESGMAEHDDFIVVMFKGQYENLLDYQPDNTFFEDLLLEQQEQM